MEEFIKLLQDLSDTRGKARLARDLGVHRTCIYKWLNGQRRPTAENYLKIKKLSEDSISGEL